MNKSMLAPEGPRVHSRTLWLGDAGGFPCACGGGNGFGRSQAGAHAAIVGAQIGLAAMQRLGRDAQGPVQPVTRPAGFAGQDLAATLAVVGRYPQPGGEGRDIGKARQIGPNLRQRGVYRDGLESGNRGQIHSQDAVQVGAQSKAKFVLAWWVRVRLRTQRVCSTSILL